MAPRLPTEQQHQAWAEALTITVNMADGKAEARALAALAAHLSIEQLTEALVAARHVIDGEARAEAWAA